MKGKSAERFLKRGFRSKKVAFGRGVEALTKTDSCARHDRNIDKNTFCWYNYFSKQYVVNYRNWVFARSVKDWSVSSYKAAFDILHRLAKEGLFGKHLGRAVELSGRVLQQVLFGR